MDKFERVMRRIYVGEQLLPCGWPNDYWITGTSLHYDANDSEIDTRSGVVWVVSLTFLFLKLLSLFNHWSIILFRILGMKHGGGSTYKNFRCTPPYGTQFFRFYIHFHQKVAASEVHAPPPPRGVHAHYGKSWIRHSHSYRLMSMHLVPMQWSRCDGR